MYGKILLILHFSLVCILGTRLLYNQLHYYSQVIDHYENPRNVGSLDKNDSNVGTGLVGAPACGDVMKLQVYQLVHVDLSIPYVACTINWPPLQIKVDDDGNIVDAKFKTFGCGSAIASSSLATEWVKGKSVSVHNMIQ